MPAARKRLEVRAGRLADVGAAPGRTLHLDHAPERRLAETAARVLGDDALVGLDGVATVARVLETLEHGAVEVAHGFERVVGIPALRVAGDDLAVARDDLLPLAPARHQRLRLLEAVQGLFGL